MTDQQGRRRFHGAFTGGYSAGHFNTVGSKEGWTPAQFVSSRQNRAARQVDVQGLVDEDDLADGIDPTRRVLAAKDGYAGPKRNEITI